MKVSMNSMFLSVMETKLVTKALKVLQLFCLGHNIQLQNYLRYQPNSKNSIDLVHLTIQLLLSIKINDHNYSIVMQTFESLTDMIQGPCKAN